jgi:signal transduction histidine kinase
VEESVYAQLLEDVGEPLIVADGELRVRLVNAAAARAIGVRPGEVEGRPLAALLAGDWQADPPVLAGGWRVGRVGSGWAARGPQAAGDSEIHRLVAAQQLAAVGQLAAGVAHEVGAPLTAISATVEYLLKNEVEAGSTVARDLEVVLAQTQRLARLVRSLLDLARPGAPALVPTDLNAVVGDALEVMKRQLRRSEVEIVLDLASGLPPVRGDQHQLQQVLINLLLNAQRAACAEGSRTRILELSTRATGEAVELRVADGGPGIAEEDRARIFLPFFSREGGAGLGLSLARGIVHRHGGTIGVESRVGHGTTFAVRLRAWSDDGG